MKPHRATTILVFGILGLVACQTFGVAAWWMGDNDLREMRHRRMDPSGMEMTKAGRVCGMVGTAILALQAIIIAIVFLVMAISHS
ncbi:MAG: hypothetical protein QOE77_1872 [Blastocatellia bacterium]|jgi:hypothetical protein|nr:hypothetical protein [Blastocatellia bacterium]